ncbi:hypothetical protein [Ralstonia pseudosolanacearum]|uniref:hypothetical protein n=1 Tax=Ralstonia pseudosolanacearum TaxID=1310165 RepID=UPI00090AD38B|nr:hypothetical protein [Ralstonia pseudosolanacearum]
MGGALPAREQAKCRFHGRKNGGIFHAALSIASRSSGSDASRARQGVANPVKRGAIEEAPFPEEQAGPTLPSAFRSPLDSGRLSVMVLLLIDDK